MRYTEKQKQALKCLMAFRIADRNIRKDEDSVCREYGISPIQFGVMERLYSNGDMSISRLMDSLLATPGNMTVVVKNMERDGYISKRQDESDRRTTILSITEKGRELIQEMLPKHAKMAEDIFNILTGEEQKELEKLLTRFGRNPE